MLLPVPGNTSFSSVHHPSLFSTFRYRLNIHFCGLTFHNVLHSCTICFSFLAAPQSLIKYTSIYMTSKLYICPTLFSSNPHPSFPYPFRPPSYSFKCLYFMPQHCKRLCMGVVPINSVGLFIHKVIHMQKYLVSLRP